MGTYSIVDQRILGVFRASGIHPAIKSIPGGQEQGTLLELSGGLSSISQLIHLTNKSNGVDSFREAFTKINNTDSVFCGGSLGDLMKDLEGGIDMGRFYGEKERLSQSDFMKKVSHDLLISTPRRTRAMSEHDGEWDHSRRYDIKPFSTASKRPQQYRVIDLICNFAISANATAEEINKYGAMVWAISDFIERAGVQTRIVSRFRSYGISGSSGPFSTGDSLESEILIEVKKPGQYIPPNLVAAAFQSNFWRRPIFALICYSAALVGRKVSDGLGRATSHDIPISFEKGRVEINPSVTSGYDKEIEKVLFDSINGKAA